MGKNGKLKSNKWNLFLGMIILFTTWLKHEYVKISLEMKIIDRFFEMRIALRGDTIQ